MGSISLLLKETFGHGRHKNPLFQNKVNLQQAINRALYQVTALYISLKTDILSTKEEKGCTEVQRIISLAAALCAAIIMFGFTYVRY